ncbi:MAG: single-stranded-DNA-specific exonuclease RecJ [Verrucomicrobiota bacterium]
MERRWIIASALKPSDDAIPWTEICGLPCIVALLQRKRFLDVAALNSFLRPRLSELSDPFLLPDMAVAVARIFRAIDARERIVLFGDYDVDGVTSLALLAELLRSYGAAPDLFLPQRIAEGYGLSRESLDRCYDKFHPQLLLAVDCGTSSLAEIAELKTRGIDVIVLDHHERKTALPDCVAVINPKTKKDCEFQYLCSVGLAFKLCHALLKTRASPDFDLKSHLDLVALGTVADIVPLQGENRLLVQRGAQEIARSKRPGLRKLMEIAGVRPPITASDIGFRLGPRLNAAGRLATAEKALQLLLTRDEKEATALAALLDAQNRERQGVEKEIYAAADAQIAKVFDARRDAAIVVGARDWHPGVLGIVASRLARKYHRPTVVVAFDADGLGKGSGRSIEGLSLVKALGHCEEWLEKFGGHAMAAGLTVREEKFAAFSEAFQNSARALLAEENLQPSLRLDHELTLAELNHELLRWHRELEPFGNGNPQPIFFARAVEPAMAPQILKEKHLVLRLRQKNHFQRAIFFDGASSELPRAPWDMAFRIAADEYQGETRLQIQVEALRASVPLA